MADELGVVFHAEGSFPRADEGRSFLSHLSFFNVTRRILLVYLFRY